MERIGCHTAACSRWLWQHNEKPELKCLCTTDVPRDVGRQQMISGSIVELWTYFWIIDTPIHWTRIVCVSVCQSGDLVFCSLPDRQPVKLLKRVGYADCLKPISKKIGL